MELARGDVNAYDIQYGHIYARIKGGTTYRTSQTVSNVQQFLIPRYQYNWMVFGWGKKKQEDVPIRQAQRRIEIALQEVPDVLAELNQTKAAHTIHDIIYLRDAIAPLIDDLMKIGDLLERDSLNVDDIDKHLAVIVIRGKKQVLEIIKKEVVPLPPISSIHDVPVFESALSQILKKIGLVLGRQSKVIHIFAKKYAGRLKADLATMTDHHAQLRRLIADYDSAVSESDKILDIISQIDTLKNSRQKRSQKITELRAGITERKVTIASIQDSITRVKSSDQYKQYVTLKDSLNAFKSQRAEIRAKIDSQFAKISRPLGRYEYGSSLDKDQKKILTELIADPFGVLTEPNTDSVMVILENVRRGISSGAISVKDVSKTLLHMTETADLVDTFTQQISEHFAKCQKLEREIRTVRSDELQTLEDDLARNISSTKNAEERIQTILDSMDDASSKVILFQSKIKDMLEQFTKSQYILKS